MDISLKSEFHHKKNYYSMANVLEIGNIIPKGDHFTFSAFWLWPIHDEDEHSRNNGWECY